jgi:pimeloyl-ACP methyl ester carboxylesterase
MHTARLRCGHLPMVDAPERFVEAVRGYLRSI